MAAPRRLAAGDLRLGRVASAIAAMPLHRPVSIDRLADRYLLEPVALEQDLNVFGFVEVDPPEFAIKADLWGDTAVLKDADPRLRHTPELSGGDQFTLLSALATWTALPRRRRSPDLRKAAHAIRRRIGPGAARLRHERGVWPDDLAEPIRATAERGQDVVVTTAAGLFHVRPSALRHTRGTWIVDAEDVATGRPVHIHLIDVVSVETADSATAPRASTDGDLTPPEVTLTVDADAGWWLRDDQSGRVIRTCQTAGTVAATLRVWPEDLPWFHGLLLRLGPSLQITRIDPRLGDQDLLSDVARSVLARYQGRSA